MVPPPSPFGTSQPAVRTTTLSAPTIPQLGSRSPGYSSNSYSHSTSPSTASGSLPEIHNHDGPGLMISPTQISSANLNAQKRAYRQRRKDPSCDACRERKVKCDATETSACSECSSRNHRCQFTKETNRRMSSIKQVQDLQSQIAELTQVNSQLRTKVSDKDPLDVERVDMKRRHSEAHNGAVPGPRRVSVPVLNNFDHVRKNIRRQAQDIFTTPRQNHEASADSSGILPELPPRTEFTHLSRSYLQTIHQWYPALHWPTFQHEVDEVYASRSFEGRSRSWISLFYAVLACGALQPGIEQNISRNTETKGLPYFETASSALQLWSHDLSVTHAQAALLLSIFATESNMRSAGSMWLASAVRVAQELQISPEGISWASIEDETRRRLWWSIYVRDRTVSLETSRPMLINEVDCDISLPSSLDDQYILSDRSVHVMPTPFHATGFLATIHITRLYAPVYQTLRSGIITAQTLRSYDEDFRSKQLQLPDAYQRGSNALFEANALPTIIALLSVRFVLFRRNLDPASSHAERLAALDRCVSIAQDTAKYVSRAVYSQTRQDPEQDWQARVAPIASSAICLHLWRCILVLCFRGEYDAALMCLHLSRAIGSIRKINMACSRNTAFFLDKLLDRLRNGRGSAQQLELDEEMIAYVSADAQGSLGQSWVWTGTDLSASSATQTPPPSATRQPVLDEPMRDALPLRTTSSSPKNGNVDWDDWGRIDHMVRQLKDEQLHRATQPPAYYPPPHNPVKRVQLAPETRSPPKLTPNPTPAPSSTSRISIANII